MCKIVITHLGRTVCYLWNEYLSNSDRGSAFTSHELKQFLHSKDIATSWTQVITLPETVKRKNLMARYGSQSPLPSKHTNCQLTLSKTFFLMRFVLCFVLTQTKPFINACLFFNASTTGSSIPSWLATPVPVLLKRYMRLTKLFVEVELVEANSRFVHIRFPDGREDTVDLKHLAPKKLDINHKLETLSQGQKTRAKEQK